MTPDHKKKILLVDDEAIIAMSESRMLEKNGYRVLTAHSGEDAVRKAAEQADFDLVLMDIDLGPGMDGTQAAEIILKTRDIPVLFLSSHTEPEIVDKTEKITSYGYVVKNSGETVILASIKMAFKLHSAHQELRKREEELGKSQWKLNFIFENTPSAITVTEMETGIVVEANKGVEWTGWTKEDVIGKSPQMLQTWVHPDEGEQIRNIIKAEGKLANHRVDFYKRDGSIAHVLMSSVFLHMDGRQYLLTVSNDITRLTEYEMELRSAKTDLEAMNEELNATVEELEATNEELQATVAEVEETKKELEVSLVEVKKTEEALRFKNLLLTTQQETSIDGILVVGDSGAILSYNNRFAEMWGMPADILAAGSDKAAMDHILDKLASPEQFLEKVSHLYAHRTETSKDELIFKDGRIFDSFSSPMFDRHGTYHGRVWYFRDITDQKRAVEALKESEEQYRTLVDNMQDVMYRCDLKGRITFATPSAAIILGCPSVEWMIGKNLKDFYINPEESVKQGEILKERGTYKQYEAILKRMDNGTPVAVLANSQFYRDRNGAIIGVEGVWTDITGRKRFEDALRESEEKYRTLVNNMQDTLYRCDTRGDLTFVSPSGARLLGHDSADELLGKNIAKEYYYDPDERRLLLENLEKYGKVTNYEVTLKRKDGTPVIVSTNSQLLYDSDGTLLGVEGIFSDITLRRQAERKLRDNEERLRAITTNVPGAVYQFFARDNGEYGISYTSSRITEIFGLPADPETLFPLFLESVYGEDRDRFLNSIKESVETRSPWNFEGRFVKPSGEMIWFNGLSTPTRRDNLLLFDGILLNITERKRTEEALRDSEEKYRTLVDNMQDVVYRSDLQGNLIFITPSGARMLGYASPESMIGLNISKELYYQPEEREILLKILKEQGKITHHEVMLKRKDNGKPVIVSTSSQFYRDRGGTIVGIEGVYNDITGRKRAEEALRRSEELYRTIFENSATANIIAAADTTILLANSNFVKLIGYSREEMEGRMSWTSFILDEYVEKMKAYHLQRIKESGKPPQAYEFKARMRSGEVRDFYMNVAMIPGSANSLGTIIDITDRVRMEEQLKRSEERFSDLVRFLPETVYEADRQGRITYVNQTGLEQFGYTQDDIDRGLNVLSIIAPRSQKQAIEKIARILQGEHLSLNEYMAQKKDGTTFPALVHSSVIYRDGQPDGFRGFLADITEIKLAERSLNESENRYRRVIHSIPIGIHLYRLEADGRLVFDGANPAADSILGVDNSIFIGKTIEEAFPALTATEAPRRYREAAEKGAPWHTEQIDYDDNEIRGAFDVHAFRIGDRLMAAAFIDITDRKKTEKALLDNQRLLNTVYDNVGAYIFMKDIAYRYTFANKKCCELFGKDLPVIIGKTDAEFFSADSIPEIMISDRRVIEQGETVTREETNIASPDGTNRRTYWTVKLPLRDSEGTIYALCGISTDITKFKQAEEALRESEDRWQFALEGAGDGLWDWNAQTDKVYFSPQWKAMLGYDVDEIGDTLPEWDSRIHPDDRERVYAELNKHLEGAIPVYTTEHRMKCKNGEYKWVLDRGKVINRTPEGKPLRVIGTHTDITILKAIQEALGKVVGEKEALLRELQHRMKNSLALITSIINLEIDRLKDNDMVGVLDNIKGRLESLASLYELLFQSDTFKEVDLGEYLKSIVRLLGGSYGAASSHLRIEEKYEPLRVNAKNAAAWGLIANELLTNSYKYAFPKGGTGTIRINLKKQKGEIILAISDNGRGLPADFDIDNPSGLGLLLVKTLALQLKGTLTFERGRENVFQVRASISSES